MNHFLLNIGSDFLRLNIWGEKFKLVIWIDDV